MSEANLFLSYSVADLHRMLSAGEISITDICTHCVRQYESFEQKYHAWVCFDGERLLKQASSADKNFVKTRIRPLEGIPIGVKDIMNTCEFPTQMGSPIWKGFMPGNDARVVHYVREAGGFDLQSAANEVLWAARVGMT